MKNLRIESLKNAHHEPSEMIAHAVFQCLVNYIEKTMGYNSRPKMAKEELDNLLSSINSSGDFDIDWFNFNVDMLKAEQELWDIYVWWKEVYLPQHEEKGWSEDEEMNQTVNKYLCAIIKHRERMWS